MFGSGEINHGGFPPGANKIKQAFDDLYHSTTDKTLKEKDEIIDAVCNLCSGRAKMTT